MTEQLITIFLIGSLTAVQALFFRPAIANLLGWIQIRTKRPFRKGDFIQCGEYEGVAVKIAVSGTTLERTDQSTVTLPNSHLTSTPTINKSASNRRPISVEFTLNPNLTYFDIEKIQDKIYNDLVETNLFPPDHECAKPLPWIKSPVVKITKIGAEGITMKVQAYNTDPTSYGLVRDLFMCRINDIIKAEQWPTADINVALSGDVHEKAV